MNEISESVIHKELDLIQGCISRMAHNGFIVKGWAILLISGVFTFWGKDCLSWWFGFIVCGILLALWVLNAYFLCKEKEYRKLYSWVIKTRKLGKDELMYELDISKHSDLQCCIYGTMFSSILPYFYVVLIITTLGVIICSKISDKNFNERNFDSVIIINVWSNNQ